MAAPCMNARLSTTLKPAKLQFQSCQVAPLNPPIHCIILYEKLQLKIESKNTPGSESALKMDTNHLTATTLGAEMAKTCPCRKIKLLL